MKTRILKLLQQNPLGMTHGDIAHALGEPQEMIIPCLHSLQWSGPVGRTGLDHWYLVDVSAAPKQAEPKNYADFVEVK